MSHATQNIRRSTSNMVFSAMSILTSILCLLFFSPEIFAATEFKTVIKNDRHNISMNMGYFEDKNQSLKIEDVKDQKFIKDGSQTFQRAFSKSAWWGKITLTNQSQVSELNVVLDYPMLDHVDLWTFREGKGMTHTRTGDIYPFSDRPTQVANFVFPVDMEEGEKIELVFRFITKGALNAPIWVFSSKKLMEWEGDRNFKRGIYYGGMLVLAFYNILLFLYFRRWSYLTFTVLTVILVLWMASINGYVYQFLWPNSPNFNTMSAPLFLSSASAFGLLLLIQFLWSALSPFERKLMRYLAVCAFAAVLISILATYSLGIRIGALSSLIYLLLNGGLSLKVLLKGYRPARLFFLSTVWIVVGGFLSWLNVLGVLGDTQLTLNAAYLGTGMMALSLSLALTDQISITQKTKEALSASFSKFVPKTLVSQLLNSREELSLGGEEKEITILFSDIAGYSTIVEHMPPNAVVEILSEYFEAMQHIVERHNGVIIEFIGDAVLAIFGAPSELENHADHGARCAVEMQIAIMKLNESWEHRQISSGWKELGLEYFNVRIGVHMGSAICGNFGSKSTMKYGVVGDTVNVAARLEQLNKEYKTKILISGEVHKNLSEELKSTAKDLGQVELKGRAKKQQIYSL